MIKTMKGLILAVLLALSVGCGTVPKTEPLGEVVLKVYTTCGVPQEVMGWGAGVEPFSAMMVVNESGDVLVPTIYKESIDLLTSHPDVQVTYIETMPEQVQEISCPLLEQRPFGT
jgi:hypothetical protein